MNVAARMLCGSGKYSHVTGLIRDRRHWLPVAQRIQFKLCLMMYKAMCGINRSDCQQTDYDNNHMWN